MILPVANLRAKELDRDLLPHREVVKAYSDVGQVYEGRVMTDRMNGSTLK